MKVKVSRREFMATTVAAGVCMCGFDGCNFLFTGETPQIHPPAYRITESQGNVEIVIDTEKTPGMLNEGKAVKIIDAKIKDRIIIANPGGNRFVALSIACTHNGAEIEYFHDEKVFKCVSYNRAAFSLDGKSIDHMNLKTLTSYPVHRQNNVLMISFSV